MQMLRWAAGEREGRENEGEKDTFIIQSFFFLSSFSPLLLGMQISGEGRMGWNMKADELLS